MISDEILDEVAAALHSSRDAQPWDEATKATRGTCRGEALVVIGTYNAASRAAAAHLRPATTTPEEGQ